MAKPTQDLGRWDRPARVILGATLIFVSVLKLLTAPGTYPAGDPRANPWTWALFALFLSGIGLLFLASAVYEPLRRASMGGDMGSPASSRVMLALSGLIAAVALGVLAIAFELPLLAVIGAASAILTMAGMRRRKG